MNRKIAIFSDLKNPKEKKITEKNLKEGLEQIAEENFKYFSPKNINMYFLENLCKLYPDSEYGNRIDITQKILATALYSSKELSNYFQKVSTENKQEADIEEKKYQTKRYKVIKSIKKIKDNLKTFMTQGNKSFKSYLNEKEEEKSIAKKRVISDVYKQLAQTVDNITKNIGTQHVKIIHELVEVNHIFSGIKNGTTQDITFTNQQIREYGAEVQQQIQRIWFNGVPRHIREYKFLGLVDDHPTPLANDQLIPYKN